MGGNLRGNLLVDIDPKIYEKLKRLAKKRGKSVDDLAKEILLKDLNNLKKKIK
jgi:hypothetical protein